MTEYILGIGHLTREDCKQVLGELKIRISELTLAVKATTKELNILKTIQFQVTQRQKEIWEENEEKNE